MSLTDAASRLTWLDWLIVLVVLAFALGGLRRGLLFGVFDLVSVLFVGSLAVLGYSGVADFVLRFAPIPRPVATIGAFVGLVAVGELAYSAIVNLIFHLSRPIMAVLGPVAAIDRVLGLLPGVVKGILFAALALLPFVAFPIAPTVSAEIERSPIASALASQASSLAPQLADRLGPDLGQGLSFLTPPQTEEGFKVNFNPTGTLTPDPSAEMQMFALVNQERQKAGVRPLTFDDRLRDVGRAHSEEMFRMGYFSHTSPVSGSPFDRMRAAGIPFLIAGENIAYAQTVDIAHQALMNSPGHRANILQPQFGRGGIGIIRSQLRGLMISQEFTN